MLSSKLLPEMEVEDNSKREQLLIGMQNLPILKQIEKIKARIEMIGAACESAEKVIADTRKAYGLGARQVQSVVPTIDKVQAAKIQEQENLLRAAINSGSRMQVDQRQLPASLPVHLVDVLTVGDGPQNFPDASGMYSKNTPTSNNVNSQGALLQNQLSQQMHDLSGTSQKFQTMQYSQPLGNQQFQGRQLQSGQMQHAIGQNQLNQGNLRNHLSQLAGTANNALFSAAQSSPNSQMVRLHFSFLFCFFPISLLLQYDSTIKYSSLRAHSRDGIKIPNMSSTIAPQSLLPRTQFGLSGAHQQRNPSSLLNDQSMYLVPFLFFPSVYNMSNTYRSQFVNPTHPPSFSETSWCNKF
ncbi:hypothetical protein C5167_007897 [Papaver somniferum]|nr:hypothetical protein C5167_007897 [Papaver somniferum]